MPEGGSSPLPGRGGTQRGDQVEPGAGAQLTTACAQRPATRPAGLQRAGSLGRVDDRDADAVLHAGERVEELEFEGDLGDGAVLFGGAIEADEWRVADGLGMSLYILLMVLDGWKLCLGPLAKSYRRFGRRRSEV